MSSVIQFTNVTKTFGQKTAVQNMTLDIQRGQVVAFLGPNGAGKTTSISMMLGLQRPTSGTVRLLDQDPTSPATRTQIGAMLQEVSLPQQMKTREVVSLFCSFYPQPLAVQKLLDMAGLTDMKDALATKLSGGQQRRLQFALAMAGNPRVLFLDEPTTGMDVSSRRAFWQQLRQYVSSEGRTVLFTTHHLEEVDGIADRVIVVSQGRVVADGSPSQLKDMAGFRYVSFTATAVIDQAGLQRLPGTDQVEVSGKRIKIRSRRSDDVLRALFTQNFPVSDVEVSSGAFEDAFLTITESADKEANAL